MLSPGTYARLLASDATRFYSLAPDEALAAGATLGQSLSIDFSRTPRAGIGRCFIIGMRGSIRNNPVEEIPTENWQSSLFFRLWWNDEQNPYTVGTGPNANDSSLSLSHGWTSYDVCFAQSEMTFHPYMRTVRYNDKLHLDIQNRSSSYALHPTMTFAIVRLADSLAPGWRGRRRGRRP